jgi:hypothetical protein
MKMGRVRKTSFFFITILLILFGTSHLWAQKDETISLKNEFVEIIVNNSDDAQGRFAMNTTGGDPSTPTDDGKPLIYGMPIPWTSYTSIVVDDEIYVFGGKSAKSAGKGGLLGERVKPPQTIQDRQGRRLVASWRMGKVLVEQYLSLDRSLSTGEPDTMKVEYVLTNEDTLRHEVGLRVMFDTMLGSNDAAPFRVKERALLTTAIYSHKDIPDFWQAFDSLGAPTIVAQGTLKGKEATPPDRVIFSDWGTLAFDLWDTTVVEGKEFIRKGEYESDTAIALLWDPAFLAPGEERRYITYYGLGNLTIASGSLSLGVTSPAEVVADLKNPQPFLIVAYLENSADKRALQVNMELKLSHGLAFWEGSSPRVALGNINSGEYRQVAWYVYATCEELGSLTYDVSVTSSNTESNSVKRSVNVVGPPNLKVSLDYPGELKVQDDRLSPFWITAKLRNEGGSSAYGVKANISTSSGIGLAPMEEPTKYLGELEIGREEEVAWRVVPYGTQALSKFTADFTSRNALTVAMSEEVIIPELIPELRVGDGKPRVIKEGETLILEIQAVNMPWLRHASFDICYDPEVLNVIRVSRGTAFVENGRPLPWEEPEALNGRIKILLNRSQALESHNSSVATIYFQAAQSGFTQVTLEGVSIKVGGEADKGFSFNVKDGRVGVIQRF